MTKTAHYFAGQKDGKPIRYVVIGICGRITHDTRERIAEVPVSGKRDARLVAKQFGAKCWNF